MNNSATSLMCTLGLSDLRSQRKPIPEITRSDLPDVVPLSDDSRPLSVDGRLDQSRHLDTLIVSNPLVNEFALVESIDGRRQDDE